MKTFLLLIMLSVIFVSCKNCGYGNGMIKADVHYTNHDTDYENDYQLYVQVSNCQVVKIFFPKGGWLDESHIKPTDIVGGEANVIDDKGREFEISFPEIEYEPAERN